MSKDKLLSAVNLLIDWQESKNKGVKHLEWLKQDIENIKEQ